MDAGSATTTVQGGRLLISIDRRGNILVMKLHGELRREHLDDVEHLIEERMDANADLPLLIDLRRYEGAHDLSTAWGHFRLVSEYGDRVAKIAVVGALDWQKLATLLVSPFTRAKERFFEPHEIDEALAWLRE
jgi:hypothetical protein